MAPITLSKSQFGATAAGKKAGASYPSYLSYVARHRAAKVAQQNADPFAPTSPQDINSVIGKYTAGYGAPQSDAQLQTSASAQLDPIIAAITGNIQKQAGVASGAIGANSAALAKQLAGIDYAAPYAGAQQDQASVDAALQQSLNGGGAALAGDLKNRLGMIGDPSVGATADALGARGTAIGTNELASGSTNLGALIANAAAAKEYGVKQPGIAQLAGLQDIAKTNQDATSKIGDATSQVEQLLPQVVQSLRSERDSKQNNKTSLAAQLYQVLTGQNVTKATAKAGLQNTAFDNGIAQENANTAAYKATTAAKTAQTRAAKAALPKVNTTLSAANKFLTDSSGNPILKGGKKQPYTPASKQAGAKALSATVLRKAGTDAEDLYHGVQKTDSKGNTVNTAYSVKYAEAIKTLMGRYPELGRPAVLDLVNRWYPAGGLFPGTSTPNGRPFPKVKGVAPGGRIGQTPETPGQIVREVPKAGQ